MVFSAKIGAQLLKRGMIHEIDIHIAPVPLGQGVRLFDKPGGEPVRPHRLDVTDPNATARVRYKPVGPFRMWGRGMPPGPLLDGKSQMLH